MAELFTHVIVAFILATILSWHYDWITPPLVTVAMVGGTLPDLSRVDLVLPADTIEAVLNIPFSWGAFHRVGGTPIVIAIGVLLVPKRLRKPVLAMLVLGAASHYLLDLFLYKPSGLASPMFWPITNQRFAVPGFYLSSDRWPTVVTAVTAAVVWFVDRRIFRDKN